MKLVIGNVVTDGVQPLKDNDALMGRDISWGLLGLLQGRKPRSRVGLGLFLENDQEAPAQYVCLQLYVREAPPPLLFTTIPELLKYEATITKIVDEGTLILQFRDDLVIYPNTGVYLGVVCVDGPKGIHPEKVTLVARIYSLNTEPSEVTVTIPISW